MNKKPVTYRDAGVDIRKAEASLSAVKQFIRKTHTPEVLADIGLFGGFYRLSGQFKQPVLVASTDGVGTKLKVAILANKHDTIGQDLVNHCINDIATSGARPLFFLDYFAMGRLEPSVFEQVVQGIAHACKSAGVPLIGGETAEMPDFYAPGDYDISGTIVGIVEEGHIIYGRKIQPGDVLIGLGSNGLHTNGYTLARKVLLSHYKIEETIPELGIPLVEELLKLHLNYYPVITEVVSHVEVHGISHVTGGGIEKNTVRLLPKELRLTIDWQAWPRPPIFQLIQKLGNVPESDMRQTFNLGIGLVFIVPETQVETILTLLSRITSWPAYIIGRVESK